MAYGEINWPLNPTTGSVYQGPNGRYWVFDGCAWTATCCPPLPSQTCSETSGILISLGLTDNIGDPIGSYVLFNLFPVGNDSYGNQIFQYVSITQGPNLNSYAFTVLFDQDASEWTMYIGFVSTQGSVSTVFATLPGVGPGDSVIGSWTIIPGYYSSYFYSVITECGDDLGLCLVQTGEGFSYTFSLLPLVPSSSSSPIEAYISPNGMGLFWDSGSGNWLFFNSGNGDVWTIPGVSTQPPIGSYSTPIGNLTLTQGACACDSVTDGVTLVISNESPDQSLFLYLSPSGNDINGFPIFTYDVCSGETSGIQFRMQYNSSSKTWELYFNEGTYSGGIFTPAESFMFSSNEYFYLGNNWSVSPYNELGNVAPFTFCGPFIEPFCITTTDILSVSRAYSILPLTGGGQFGYAIFGPYNQGFITWDGSNWSGTLPGTIPQVNITCVTSANQWINPIGSWSNDGGFTSVVTSIGPCVCDNTPF